MAVMKVEVLGDKRGMREVIMKQPGRCVKCLGCLGCYLCCCTGCFKSIIMGKNNITDVDLFHSKYIKMIEERLTKNDFLTGKNISILDLSLYGMLYPYATE